VEQRNVTFNQEDIGTERRRLVGQWEDLLEKVRQLPQFRHFLRPVPFFKLHQSIAEGQVIIINVSRGGVDALIFDAARQIVHVPLPNADFNVLHKLAVDIQLHPFNASEIQRRNYTTRYVKPALRTVWNNILVPIFDKIHVPLDGNSGSTKRRIWWYPTGPLTSIPIHAAGPGRGDMDVSRLVISSYVTTLSSLFQAQNKTGRGMTRLSKLLAVSRTHQGRILFRSPLTK
jgi:hypothetical protein